MDAAESVVQVPAAVEVNEHSSQSRAPILFLPVQEGSWQKQNEHQENILV